MVVGAAMRYSLSGNSSTSGSGISGIPKSPSFHSGLDSAGNYINSSEDNNSSGSSESFTRKINRILSNMPASEHETQQQMQAGGGMKVLHKINNIVAISFC